MPPAFLQFLRASGVPLLSSEQETAAETERQRRDTDNDEEPDSGEFRNNPTWFRQFPVDYGRIQGVFGIRGTRSTGSFPPATAGIAETDNIVTSKTADKNNFKNLFMITNLLSSLQIPQVLLAFR